MLSYTGRRNLFGTLTNNSTSTNLTTGDTLMNAADKRILGMRQWPFMEVKDTSLTTTASTQFKEIPQKLDKVKAITVTVSSVIHTPREIHSEREWNMINQTSITSDIPEYYFIRNRQFGLWPTPASSSNTITLYGRQVTRDLNIADYTTGTITTTSSTTITGSGTSWHAGMAGRWLRITDGNAANSGDHFWYEISTAGSTTSITLVKPYAGTALAAASANYTIGQMAPYPEGYHELPVYDACEVYFTSIQPNSDKAQLYKRLKEDMLAQLIKEFSEDSSSVVLDDGEDTPLNNPNLYVSSIS